jgi:hypothetical protein
MATMICGVQKEDGRGLKWFVPEDSGLLGSEVYEYATDPMVAIAAIAIQMYNTVLSAPPCTGVANDTAKNEK